MGSTSSAPQNSSRWYRAIASSASAARLGAACAGARELDVLDLAEHGREPQRAVAAQQRLLAARLELGDEIVGRADLVLGRALHTARHRSVQRVVQLVAAGVDRGNHERARVPQRVREQIEARNGNHRDAQRLRERPSPWSRRPAAR